jgi:hypothetical protein
MSLRLRRGAADYVAIVESVALAVGIELALRLVSFSTVLRLLDQLKPSSLALVRRVAHHRLERFAAAAYRVLPISATCLRESLVLYALLRRRGAAPMFRIGVRRNGAALAAHAWVEHTVGSIPAHTWLVLTRVAWPSPWDERVIFDESI